MIHRTHSNNNSFFSLPAGAAPVTVMLANLRALTYEQIFNMVHMAPHSEIISDTAYTIKCSWSAV